MPNRLASQSSPYLRQHAENPVDWYPWGAEALAAAADRDVPILLSIGYSACHWCHVMAHESFEDEPTAVYMNEHFVCVKVDREERPDIDAIYMEAAQAMSGQGGWPLTAFLTPDQVPFFAGTYFPKAPRPNMASFMQLMESIVALWREHRAEINERSDLIAQQMRALANLETPDDALTGKTLDTAVAALRRGFDEVHGGFGGAPKFPPHSVLEFLLGRGDGDGRELALQTLRAIAAGGIHDQLGGGFARYSVDARWQVPHFEKMLYDNALLARAQLHAFRADGAAAFAEAARTTLDWMLAELLGPEGGFAAALDADSPNEDGRPTEGAFYTWTIDELREVIEAAAPGRIGDFFGYWGVTEDGALDGRNVLAITQPELRPPEALVEEVRVALLRRREQRPRPARDDKCIAAWNAMALSALAEAGAVLGDQRYRRAAVDCADFIERRLARPDGRLRRSWTNGVDGPPGYLEDHAHVAAAYLTLYELGGDEHWFERARQLGDILLEHFADDDRGGFFSVAADHEALIVRRKDIEDNPTASGNSAAAMVLLRLAALTGDERCRAAATRTLQAVQSSAARVPLAFGQALEAIAFALGPVDEVALVGPAEDRRPMLDAVLARYRPRLVLATADSGQATGVPLLAGRDALDGRGAAYVCHDFTCQRPVTEADELARLLEPSTP